MKLQFTPVDGRFGKARQVAPIIQEFDRIPDYSEISDAVVSAFHRYHRRHDLYSMVHSSPWKVVLYTNLNNNAIATVMVEEVKETAS